MLNIIIILLELYLVFYRPKMIKIIGISSFYNDSAVCLVITGEIISAVQEE